VILFQCGIAFSAAAKVLRSFTAALTDNRVIEGDFKLVLKEVTRQKEGDLRWTEKRIFALQNLPVSMCFVPDINYMFTY
jgi:hypothetical protein